MQIIHLYKNGKVVKTLVFRLKNETEAIWECLVNWAAHYDAESIYCVKLYEKA